MAGQYYTGTLLASPIVRGSSGDTYGTHHSILGVGGYMEVNTIAQRNAIPVDTINGIYFDGLSSGQRRLGMLVHVYQDNNIYHLQPNVTYSTWSGYTNTQKLNALADNNNWNIFISSGSTTSGGQKISSTIYQLTHGFIVGDVIGFNGITYVKVTSTTASTIEPLGIVSSVIDANDFILTYSGYIGTSSVVDYNSVKLSGGTVYYISNVAGKLSKLQPTGLTQVSKPMLVALASGNTSIVLQYRGYTQAQQGLSVGTFNTYTGNTQQFLNKTVTGATNIGYFSGYTGVQHLIITNTVSPTYNGTYDSAYNYYYRDSSGIIRIGSPTYNGSLRRGYVRTVSTPIKSWVYNQYTGASNQIGWILVDGDITQNTGNFLSAFPATGAMYTGVTWNTGAYNNGGNVVLSVSGSLTTGSTYNIGGPIYSNKQYEQLRLRTIMPKGNNIKVTYDNNFIYISGATVSGGSVSSSGVTNAANIGTGTGLFSSKVSNVLQFKSLVQSGKTTISNSGNNVIIYSSGDSQIYNLSSPAAITLGGITCGDTLAGQTYGQIFEKLLVPTLNPILVNPSNGFSMTPSSGSLFEVGCTQTLAFSATFSQGSITPAYCGGPSTRSGLPSTYNYTGTGLPPTVSTTALLNNQSVGSYTALIGLQSWGSSVSYSAGSQPLNSKGGNYCSPLAGSTTSTIPVSIEGVYPLYGTTSTIGSLSKQTLVSMINGNNIQLNLVAETGGYKQKFEIPCAWLTSRPLVGVCLYNSVSGHWEYQGGTTTSSLSYWNKTSTVETIQTIPIGYCQYTYNGVDRSLVCIELAF